MATHYTCDRCGGNVGGPAYPRHQQIEIEWPDTNRIGNVEPLVLQFNVFRPGDSQDKPDLCSACYAHILREVASRLDSDRDVKVAV